MFFCRKTTLLLRFHCVPVGERSEGKHFSLNSRFYARLFTLDDSDDDDEDEDDIENVALERMTRIYRALKLENSSSFTFSAYLVDRKNLGMLKSIARSKTQNGIFKYIWRLSFFFILILLLSLIMYVQYVISIS